MRVSALLSRTKKFFSKKRRAVAFELKNIHADGFSRARVESDAREFHAKAINSEAKASYFKRREMESKKMLHDNRLGRSDGYLREDTTPKDRVLLREDMTFNRDELNYFSERAKNSRQKSVVRRLYSQKMLKSRNKK